MTEIYLQDFRREVNCIYDGERYSIRDNGAVLRHSRAGKRRRSADDQWTFGTRNSQNGYMHIGSVRIHRIVATAFHGKPPTSEHIVDHIDTNRQSNRPENLRWLTRLENALFNPITVKRIALICGSIEAFLQDPSKLRDSKFDQNFEWMRKVSPQEAQACLERMHLWAKNNKLSGGGSLGEWVFKPVSANAYSAVDFEENFSLNAIRSRNASKGFCHFPLSPQSGMAVKMHSKISDLVMAMTPRAAQLKWRVPAEFPCCPQAEVKEGPIFAYMAKLKPGEIFARNHLSTSIILQAAIVDDKQAIYVMCEMTGKSVIKPWSVANVTFEDGLYVHTSMGTFFTPEGAEKEFYLGLGREWSGGDTFDDYCS